MQPSHPATTRASRVAACSSTGTATARSRSVTAPSRAPLVFVEHELLATTDADGYYDGPRPSRDGIAWVRARDGWEPGPYWSPAPAGQPVRADFAIRERSVEGPFSFVVGSDTHAGILEMPITDQLVGLAQAASQREQPYFIAITGDLTQGNAAKDFEAIGEAIRAIDVPYVPIPGNHDWYDGGATYRAYFGPPTYSFDAGGYHFAVLNDAASLDDRLDFLDTDLGLIDDGRAVIIMMHAPPDTELRLALEQRRIDYLLTGHMHANRVLVHDTFIEYNTQPLVMGGIDMTPAGYRVFRDEGGSLSVHHRNTVNDVVAVVVSPVRGQLAEPCEARLVVSVQGTSDTVSVVAQVDGVGNVPLTARGGWAYASERLLLCEPGSYAAVVTVAYADGSSTTLPTAIEVGEVGEVAPSPATDWPAY